MFPGMNWYSIKDGDPMGLNMFHRHYSYRKYKDGRKPKLFVGPGEKLVLMLSDGSALFVWRKFIDNCIPHQDGVNCSIFRNESDIQSSKLIIEANQIAWQRWPGERLYTYVNPKKVKSTNPGYCFIMAGWTKLPYTSKSGKIVLEKLP